VVTPLQKNPRFSALLFKPANLYLVAIFPKNLRCNPSVLQGFNAPDLKYKRTGPSLAKTGPFKQCEFFGSFWEFLDDFL
jgi:hypothetical protein